MKQNRKLIFDQLSSYILKSGDDITAESLPAVVEKLLKRKPTEEELKDAKWTLAAIRAQRTATWAKTMTKQLISQSSGTQPRWHVINFLGLGKAESRGIVDLLAIRKSHKDPASPLKKGDLFEVVLLQVKGGKAKWPTKEDRERLRRVQSQYHATAILLSEWKLGKKPNLYQLNGDEWGEPINPADVFCPSDKAKKKKSVRRDSSESAAPLSKSKATSVTYAASTATLSPAKKAWATRKATAAIEKKK